MQQLDNYLYLPYTLAFNSIFCTSRLWFIHITYKNKRTQIILIAKIHLKNIKLSYDYAQLHMSGRC